MIVWYFCRRFLGAFLLILGVMTSVLSGINVIGKNIFASSELVVALFIGALPFMAVFVYPLALLCGCFFALYNAKNMGEFVLINFFPRLRYQLVVSFFFTALTATLMFTPLVFWVAPRSYDWGKQFLYSFAEKHFVNLAPGFLHFPLADMAVYFEHIEQRGADTVFYNFFLIQSKVTKEAPLISFVLWGNQVILLDKKLLFKQGCLVGIDKKAEDFAFVATFDEGLLYLDKFFGVSSSTTHIPVKYKTIHELWIDKSIDSLVERWRRYVQILWVFCTPLCASVLGRYDYIKTIPQIIMVASVWFFILYIVLLSLDPLIKQLVVV